MRYLLVIGVLLLTGCEHSILLVKAVRVSTSGQEFVRCSVQATENVSKDIKAKADDLCKEVQTGTVVPIKK
jgi:hypothetical protein